MLKKLRPRLLMINSNYKNKVKMEQHSKSNQSHKKTNSFYKSIIKSITNKKV
jgi:hypothetical protein